MKLAGLAKAESKQNPAKKKSLKKKKEQSEDGNDAVDENGVSGDCSLDIISLSASTSESENGERHHHGRHHHNSKTEKGIISATTTTPENTSTFLTVTVMVMDQKSDDTTTITIGRYQLDKLESHYGGRCHSDYEHQSERSDRNHIDHDNPRSVEY